MKIIRGEQQVALVLSESELRYITNCVGGMSDDKVKKHNDEHFPGTESPQIGISLWNPLEKEVRARNKR